MRHIINPRFTAARLVFATLTTLILASPTYADRRPPLPSVHWVLDSRFHHNHYYPARGYVVNFLPAGSIRIKISDGHLFFNAGVWYRPHGKRYVVVAPPIGARITLLPPTYTTIWVGSIPYYYANGVYYLADSYGGYLVVDPPPESSIVTLPPPPQDVSSPPMPVSSPPPTAPTPGESLYVYPKSGQTASQIASDRSECTKWATSQTGYDPSKPTSSNLAYSDFKRAFSACMEAHGYTVR